MVGTPLTHERFLRRHRGAYGPAIRAGQGLFPWHATPLARLYCCGDFTFPGACQVQAGGRGRTSLGLLCCEEGWLRLNTGLLRQLCVPKQAVACLRGPSWVATGLLWVKARGCSPLTALWPLVQASACRRLLPAAPSPQTAWPAWTSICPC